MYTCIQTCIFIYVDLVSRDEVMRMRGQDDRNAWDLENQTLKH